MSGKLSKFTALQETYKWNSFFLDSHTTCWRINPIILLTQTSTTVSKETTVPTYLSWTKRFLLILKLYRQCENSNFGFLGPFYIWLYGRTLRIIIHWNSIKFKKPRKINGKLRAYKQFLSELVSLPANCNFKIQYYVNSRYYLPTMRGGVRFGKSRKNIKYRPTTKTSLGSSYFTWAEPNVND